MLTELSIRNLAVVESASISFRDGFHVLTGETGAGKSIVVDALGLAAGGRGSAELVRAGCEKAEIEVQFDLPADHPVWRTLADMGIEAVPGEPLIIRRDISTQGKSVCRINGRLVNLSALREAGELLINIHGQHEHQSLTRAERHIDWLDLYDAERIGPVKARYQEEYREYVAALKQLRELRESGQQALHMADLYRFQLEEIAAAQLKVGEDESLMEEKRMLSNAEKLYQNVAEAYEAIYAGKGLSTVARAIQRIEDIADVDPAALKPLLEQIRSAYYQLEDAAFQLRDYRDRIEFNPSRLEQIERRLDFLASLRRKYGNSIREMIEYGEKIKRELERLENKDETIRRLETETNRRLGELVAVGRELSKLRRLAAERLAREIERELQQLQMEKTRFAVFVGPAETGIRAEEGEFGVVLTKDGLDQVEFLISTNPGEPLRPLAKIASGGELSRIMLAMKTIFARIDRVPVLIFDEVDTGVSGRAAQAIAEKLSDVSRHCQVFSITHLPQVACMADTHYLVSKSVEEDRTYTQVTVLTGEDRVRELARMLGGVEITETTLNHAREMIALAQTKKMASKA